MDKEYYKRFCECEDWKRADNGSDYGQGKLYELLKCYPDECPYCHSKLKTRLREIMVEINIEPSLGRHTDFGVPISLQDFKQLLEETKGDA